MAEIPVHKKSSSSWWIWLLVAIVVVAIVWFLFGAFNNTRDTAAAPAVTTEPVPAVAVVEVPTTTPPAGSPDTSAVGNAGSPDTSAAGNAGSSMAATAGATAPAAASGEAMTDASAYAAASDKLALAGRPARLDDVRVARIVGPKTFTIAAGSEEIYVMVGKGVNMAVGSQGQIDKGNVLDLQGSFQRLKPEEISDIANNRFRDLTPQEREFLRDRKVYLEATDISKVS